jgi:malonate decarboxylase alpha subunit
MVQSVLSLPSHLDVFERGIASKLDFSFSGPQSVRLANLVAEGRIQIGAIHTYLELFGRYFIDLTPRVALVAAQPRPARQPVHRPEHRRHAGHRRGHRLRWRHRHRPGQRDRRHPAPRRHPADWVNFVVQAPKPNHIEPLFTRDPAQISEIQVLMAMMAIKGIYAEYGVQRLNHGIGFDTAAIELLLPTYAESLGLKGKICQHWALNPHPALIPAIESGFVRSVHSFGSELGMENYIAARGDVFFTGADGSMRSNRAFSQTAGHYACDMFIGSTLQIDLQGNSSTATRDRIAGFGGAPNMGADARGRRHASPPGSRPASRPRARAKCRAAASWWCRWWRPSASTWQPAFVERLDAWNWPSAPDAAAAGDDLRRRRQPHADRGRHRQPAAVPHRRGARTGDPRRGRLHRRGPGARPRDGGEPARPRRDPPPEDLGISVRDASRDLLAARSVKDLVRWSGGLYDPPKRFRNW